MLDTFIFMSFIEVIQNIHLGHIKNYFEGGKISSFY